MMAFAIEYGDSYHGRKPMMKIGTAALCLALTAGTAHAQMQAGYAQYIMYKSGAEPLPQNPNPGGWSYSSGAYSAITVPMPFDLFKQAKIAAVDASLLLVWQPNSPDGAMNGVGLAFCPSNTVTVNEVFQNCDNVAEFDASDTVLAPWSTPGCSPHQPMAGGPFPCRYDITTIFNQLITNGVPYYMVPITYGNGTTGPMLFNAELDVVWAPDQ